LEEDNFTSKHSGIQFQLNLKNNKVRKSFSKRYDAQIKIDKKNLHTVFNILKKWD
jgi:hypothetical protein